MPLRPIIITRRLSQKVFCELVYGGVYEPFFADSLGTRDEAGTAAGFWGEDGTVPGEVSVEVGLDFAVYLVDYLGCCEVCDYHCPIFHNSLLQGGNLGGVDASEGWACC